MGKEEFTHVEIKGDSVLTTLIVNGVDLSNCASEVTYHKKGTAPATQDLRFEFMDSFTLNEFAIPKIPDAVASALKGSELNG